jgi:hypothetical protein
MNFEEHRKLLAEASAEFYKWEERENIPNLNDADRHLWIVGYLHGKESQHDQD